MVSKKQKILVKFALKNLGKSYKFGAKSYEAPKTFDCSSFIQYLYKKIRIDLPRTALDQTDLGKTIPNNLNKLEVGDLIFVKGGWGHYNPKFPKGIGHVSMYLGDNKIIHSKYAENEKGVNIGKVMTEDAKNWLSRKDIVIIKRIL